MRNSLGLCISSLLPAILLSTGLSAQEVFKIDTPAKWNEWTFPQGAIEFLQDGSIKPLKYTQPYNAVLNADQFTHKLKQGEVTGGVWQVGTNARTVDRVIDGDPETFWQPSQADPVENWWLEINLGRLVAVKEIRLHFPDQEGARPLREFRVFGSDGKHQAQSEDVFAFNLIGGTTKRNEETTMAFPVAANNVTRAVLRQGTPTPEADTSTEFAPVQYVRIIVDNKSEDAALAEVEVVSFGENIAPGTLARGGFIDDQGKGRTLGLADGDVNTFWEELNVAIGEEVKWNWNLGAIYWINRIVFVADQLTTTWYSPRVLAHRLLGSDGSQKPSGETDFEVIFDFPDRTWSNPQPLTYLFYPYKRLQNIFTLFADRSSGAISEIFIFPIGHVAQVEMTSDFIQISNRPQVMQTLEWDAEIPPGTQILAQTRSGNTLNEITLYYHRNGKEVSEEAYNSLKRGLKGEVIELIETGEDWSGWSNIYQFSGQEFLSPSPRRFVQFRVVLNSDQPEVAPSLRSLSLNHTDAFLAGAIGAISPKEAEAGVAQMFTYKIEPDFGAGDKGFNRILIKTPSEAVEENLKVRLDGTEIEPMAVEIGPDSLLLQLPQTARRQAVEISLEVTVLENPYLFNVSLGHTDEPEFWQEVDPAERFATSVFLPDVPNTKDLIGNITVQSPIITPNGDGISDQTEIRFSVLKASIPAKARIYSLDGTLVRRLEGERGGDGFWVFNWGGLDLAGVQVPPGNYICRLELDAQVGSETVARVLSVVY